MATVQLVAIRHAARRLHIFAEAYPDLRYVELWGPAIRDDELTRAALTAFIGNAECRYGHDATKGIAYCVYGEALDEEVAALNVVSDDVWLAVRHLIWHSREMGKKFDVSCEPSDDTEF